MKSVRGAAERQLLAGVTPPSTLRTALRKSGMCARDFGRPESTTSRTVQCDPRSDVLPWRTGTAGGPPSSVRAPEGSGSAP
eukprot:7174745-Prymnesium_polylepis.1